MNYSYVHWSEIAKLDENLSNFDHFGPTLRRFKYVYECLLLNVNDFTCIYYTYNFFQVYAETTIFVKCTSSWGQLLL